MIKGVIFDLDGTLFDSEQLWFKINKSFLEKNNLHPKDEDLYQTIGGSMDLTYHTLFKQFPTGQITMGKLRHDYDEFNHTFEVDYEKMIDKDANEVLSYLKNHQIKIGLASASSMEYIKATLEKCKILDYFDILVSGEEFVHNKPNPEVYEVACKKLDLNKDEILVVEDSNIGIEASKNAGLLTLGIKGFGNQNLKLADISGKDLKSLIDYLEYQDKKSSLIHLDYQDKEIILIPTAHVSKESANLTRMTLQFERPDSICVELDDNRYQSITEKKKWESTSVASIIKEHKVGYFLINLFLSAYQRKMAKSLGSATGQEMMEGIKASKENNIPLVLADRSVQTTFSRIWRKMNFKDKTKILTYLFGSIFDEEEKVSEEDLVKLSQKDELTAALQEVEKEFPQIADVLVKERDQYLAQKIKTAPGKKVVAVLGAAHTIGIQKWIHEDISIEKLDEVPPKKKTGTIILWAISILLILLVVLTYLRNPSMGKSQIINWILWHGILSALGALICLAHPLTILVSFIVAPLSSLSPLLAAGWFAGLTEAYLRKPTVKDFDNLAEDTNNLKGFFKNKITKILLIVVLCNIGSSLATLFRGVDIIKTFIGLFA